MLAVGAETPSPVRQASRPSGGAATAFEFAINPYNRQAERSTIPPDCARESGSSNPMTAESKIQNRKSKMGMRAGKVIK
jgi:hypothetical protein